MKHNKRKKSQPLKRYGRLSLLTVVGVIVVFALGAITVISRQKSDHTQSVATDTKVGSANKAPANLITVKVAGQNLQVDPQTGQIKPLTPQEAQQLAQGLKGMLNRSSEGLVAVRERDGSDSMNLQGRFQNVTVARVNEDGSVAQSCVDNPEAAANFFGIDPQLLDVERLSQPTTPVRKNPIQ